MHCWIGSLAPSSSAVHSHSGQPTAQAGPLVSQLMAFRLPARPKATDPFDFRELIQLIQSFFEASQAGIQHTSPTSEFQCLSVRERQFDMPMKVLAKKQEIVSSSSHLGTKTS